MASAAAWALPLPAWAQDREPPLLAAAQLRMGLERLVKLELEARVLPTGRAQQESERERQRLEAALRTLADSSRLSARRASQVQRAADDAQALMGSLKQAAPSLLSESEAVAVRLGFVTTALSGDVSDPARGALVDLLARAASTALRVGKLNFAAAALGPSAGGDVTVAALQSLTEFRSALQAVAQTSLNPRAQADFGLAQNQWLLFQASLGANGLAKSPERLSDVATTTDRMAEALGSLARRVMQG